MATVAEILKASGLDDAAIAALDAKALAAFNSVLTTAEGERTAAQDAVKQAEAERVAAKAAQDAAELAQRANAEFYEGTIVPSLNGWDAQEQKLKQEIADAKNLAEFYEKQNKTAREAGFIATDVPLFSSPVANNPSRDGQGKFVTNGGGTPGSPTFKMEEVENRLGQGLDNSVWALQEYQRLSGGQFLPDSISTLAQEASSNKLSFKDYVSRKYDFPSKQSALQAKAKDAEKAAWLAEATAPLQEQLKAKDVEWQKKLEDKAKEVSERGGNNPDVRRAAISDYPEVKKAVEAGTRPDPLSFKNQAERSAATRQQIRADVTANEEVKHGAVA